MNAIVTHITQALQGQYDAGEAVAIAKIVCHELLNISEVDLLLRKDINLSPTNQRLMEEAIVRLKRFEPIQYICERCHFYGLTFKVTPDVLIPRPETEELVQLILKNHSGKAAILDIGTGSGCIAISLAHHRPEAHVEAWDISARALEVARENAVHNQVDVTFCQTDVLTAHEATPRFDIIVSNPPYIAEKEKAVMDANVLEWEPETALFVPDNDPLRFYRRIAELGREALNPGGAIYVEINQAYGVETLELFRSFNYSQVALITDLFGNHRMVKAGCNTHV